VDHGKEASAARSPPTSEREAHAPGVLVASALDPTGGAGMAMDIRALLRAGCAPAPALTGIAVQSSRGVSTLSATGTDMFARQVISVMEGVRPAVAKAGALVTPGNARVLAEAVGEHSLIAVVDPVTTASGGGALTLAAHMDDVLAGELLPAVFLLTPNLPEARRLAAVVERAAGREEGAEGDGDPVSLCRTLTSTGCRAVLLKGGHVPEGGEPGVQVEDLLYIAPSGPGSTPVVRRFVRSRCDVSPHGTGCALASLIAGRLARSVGMGGVEGAAEVLEHLPSAVLWAEAVMGRWIRSAAPLSGDAGAHHMGPDLPRGPGVGVRCACQAGAGALPPAPLPSASVAVGPLDTDDGAPAHDTPPVGALIDRYLAAMERFMSIVPSSFIPEVGTNMSYALPDAREAGQVLALDSRVVRVGADGVCTAGEVEAGGSHHTARIVLAAMSFDPAVRCAINLRYRPAAVDAGVRAGLSASSFSREDQPPDTSSMEWGTRRAIEDAGGRVPDIIFDLGGHGKEPMLRVLGRNPEDVVSKVEKMVGAMGP